jgi:TonB-dependent receptor
MLKLGLFSSVAMIYAYQPAAAQDAAGQATTTPAESDAAPAAEDDQGEAIVVTGIRSSLQNALQNRREADVILDGISSDDIGSTPDLNLGEALQRIPGVQLDRSEERRNATISVRGLPGSFARTTLMGQNIATPTRGSGNGSPFGIFDASIFNGANVIKSFTADIPAGGLSANVDLRLTSALSRREGFVLRTELQYEETTKDFNPSYFGSVAKKLTDNLGVYANVAYSKQSYRRDEVSINAYNSLSAARAQQFGVAPTAADGTPQILLYPGQVRIQSRQEQGDRLSASAGAEWQPTDTLSIRLDGIYTRRKLDEAKLDVLRLQFSDVAGNLAAGDTTGQVIVGTNPDGTRNIVQAGTGAFGDNFTGNVFVAPSVSTLNPQYFPDSRRFEGNDQSWAVYPQIEYKNEGLTARLIGTYSKATGADTEVLLGARVDSATNPTALASRINQNLLTNGITLNVNTGAGNFSDFGFSTSLPATLFDLAGRTYNIAAGNRATATTNTIAGRRTNVLTVAGSSPSVERTLKSIAGDVEQEFEFGPLRAVKFGGRYDKEEGDIEQRGNTLLGAQLGNLDNNIVDEHFGFSSGGTYFGGRIPGVLVDPVVYGIDIDRFLSAISTPSLAAPGSSGSAQTGPNTIVPPGIEFNPATGLYVLPVEFAVGNVLTTLTTRNFETSRKNVEAYALARYELEDWIGVPVRGNFGIRYVDARLKGQTTIVNPAVPANPASGRYNAWLPSANLIAEISDSIDFRAAYYQTFEAFDVAEFTPVDDFGTISPGTFDGTTGQRLSPDTIVANFSTIDISPRESDAFDAVLSWYNNPGGVVSLGYFNKNVSVIQRLQSCPVGGSVTIPIGSGGTFTDQTFSPLYVNPNNTDQCRLDLLGNRLGQDGDPIVNIFQTVNVPERVTVQGLEAQIQQDLTFLPGFLGNFGFVLNATRVFTEKVDGVEFFNVAKFFANAIAYYEDDLIEARLAYNYAGKTNLAEGGTFNGAGRTVKARDQLDFSGAIKPFEGLQIRAEVFNITNSIREDYQDFTALNRRASYDGRTYSVGLTYQF